MARAALALSVRLIRIIAKAFAQLVDLVLGKKRRCGDAEFLPMLREERIDRMLLLWKQAHRKLQEPNSWLKSEPRPRALIGRIGSGRAGPL